MTARGTRWRRAAIAGVALLGVLAVLVYLPYRRDLEAARDRVATGARIAHTACGPIQYADAGEGPPLLVIHGAGGGFDQGLLIAERVQKAGFRIIAPSRFGYLGTPVPADASPPAQADAHACLLDALGLSQVSVLGASAGGPSAVQLCLRHPERCRALVLLVPLAWSPQAGGAPSPLSSPAARKVMETALGSDFLYWALSHTMRDTLVETLLATPLADFQAAPPQDQAFALAMLANGLPAGPRAPGLAVDGQMAASLKRYDLEHLTVPTLVIAVRDDRFGIYAGAAYTAAHIPGARLLDFPDGGHMLVGHQAEVNAAIVRFLHEAGP